MKQQKTCIQSQKFKVPIFSGLVLLGVPSLAWAFPADSDWVPVQRSAQAIVDIKEDATGGFNIVGEITDPAFMVYKYSSDFCLV